MNLKHIGIFLLASAMFCGAISLAGQGKIIERVATFTNTTAVSATDSAIIVDTFGISPMTTEGYCYKTVMGRIYVAPSLNAKRGYGLDDSAYIQLYTSIHGQSYIIAADTNAALPCSLIVTKNSAIAGIDTLWKEDLWFVVYLNDTTGDTVMTAEHKVTYQFILKE